MKPNVNANGDLDARRAAAKRTALIVGAIAVCLFVLSDRRSGDSEMTSPTPSSQRNRGVLEGRAGRLRGARSCSGSRWCRSTASPASTWCSASSRRRVPRAKRRRPPSSKTIRQHDPRAVRRERELEAAVGLSARGAEHRSCTRASSRPKRGSTRPTTRRKRSSAMPCRSIAPNTALALLQQDRMLLLPPSSCSRPANRGACPCASSSIRSCPGKSPSSRSRIRSTKTPSRRCANGVAATGTPLPAG